MGSAFLLVEGGWTISADRESQVPEVALAVTRLPDKAGDYSHWSGQGGQDLLLFGPWRAIEDPRNVDDSAREPWRRRI